MVYSTIPADLESEATLLNKPTKTKTSTKALVFGFAAAAFVLGAVAATATTSKTPSASTAFHTKEMATCSSPWWMQDAQALPPAFTKFKYLHEGDKFEKVEPGSAEYCDAFKYIEFPAGNAGSRNDDGGYPAGTWGLGQLFGDYGTNFIETIQPYGGLKNAAVVKVKDDQTVKLYSTRHGLDEKDAFNGDGLVGSVWFGDESAYTNPRVDFSTYANDRVAIPFNRSLFIECELRPGALVIVGSGAPRDTSTILDWKGADYNFTKWNIPHGTTIKEMQAPKERFVQYIFNPMVGATDCSYWPIKANDLWSSKDEEATQYLENGRFLGPGNQE